MVGPFSYPIAGKHQPRCNYSPMQRAQKVMARFLVLTGFIARGLDRNHTGCRPISHSGPDEPSTGELVANLRDLLSSALKPGSRKLYQRAWAVFQDFAHRFYKTSSPQLPLIPNMLPLFISYLSARQLAPSTIASYISALSYVHKL